MTAYTVPLIMNAREEAEPSVAAGEPVILERELGDRQSIRVMSAGGRELGHVHRQSAKWIADRLDRGKYLDVRIAPLISIEGEGRGRRVQLSVNTEPRADEERPWWRRLFGG